MTTITLDRSCIGTVISEHPFVKLLTVPRYAEYEIVPGMIKSRYEAIAQVGGGLALVEVRLSEIRGAEVANQQGLQNPDSRVRIPSA